MNGAAAVYAVLFVSWTIAASQDMSAEKGDMYYESDEFWSEGMSPGRECEPGARLITEGEWRGCVPCPIGHYNFAGARVDECFKCPYGTFANETAMESCHDCESWDEGRRGKFITKQHGSTSSDQCFRPDEVLGNFVEAKVGFYIKVEGADFCTGIDSTLWGVSRVAPFDGHFYQCDYTPAGEGFLAFTEMSMEFTMPKKFAWEVWTFMDMLSTHLAVGNAYVELGHPFLEKISQFIENHSSTQQLGLLLNIDMLTIMDDFKVLEFTPHFKGVCPVTGDDSQFCRLTTEDSAPYQEERFYAEYTLPDGLSCDDNEDYTRIRNAFEYGKTRNFPCLNWETPCRMKLATCESTFENVAAVTFIIKEESMTFGQFEAVDLSFTVDGMDFNAVKKADSCGASAMIAGFSNEFMEQCGETCEAGFFSNDAGMCQKCPFGSWGDDGKQCNSCGWNFETPFWGMTSEDMCMEENNDWKMSDDDDWSSWEKIRLNRLAGENSFTLSVTPEVNMCGVAGKLKEVKGSCKETFSEAELTWNDDTDYDSAKLEQIVCLSVMNVGSGFDAMCEEDWDKSWDDIFDDPNLEDVVCYVFKRVKDLDGLDTADECANLDVSQYMMSMPAEFNGEMNSGASAMFVPILRRLKNLETMNFVTVAEAGEAMMATMGLDDMTEFTGWGIADDVVDLVLEVPRGFRMAQFDFDASYEKSNFICENGEPKRDCWDSCNYENCKIYEVDSDKDLQCRKDECNNCKDYWFWTQDETENDYECASCEFPDKIDNGVLLSVNDDGVSAEYRCNNGYVSMECSTRASCEYDSESKDKEFPTCVEDKCNWPEIEHATKWRDWQDAEDWGSCPYAYYKCDDGWMAVKDVRKVECEPSNEFAVSHYMKCIEKCKFPNDIEFGSMVEQGRHDDGTYFAIYECEDGYYLRDYEEATCSNTDGEEPVAFAMLPRCSVADRCEFPDEINGAYRTGQEFDEYTGRKSAWYECPGDMMMEGNSYLHCSEEDPSQVVENDISCYEYKYCSFPEEITGGRIVSDEDEDESRDYARYECNEGYKFAEEGSGYASCDGKTGTVSYLPKCVKEDSCDIPDYIEGGYQSEKYYNNAKYDCFYGSYLPDSIQENGGWVYCEGSSTLPEHPRCMTDSCYLHDALENGKREEKRENEARYSCDNEQGYKLPDAIREAGGWVTCEGQEIKPESPVCVRIADSCNFNAFVPFGVRGEEGPLGITATYSCADGYRLLNGIAVAVCDLDGNIEYPECIENTGSSCDFGDVVIENGRVSAEDRDAYSAAVVCSENHRIPPGDDNRVYCGSGSDDITYQPTCEPYMMCDFPAEIENGYKTEDMNEDGSFRYECKDGYHIEKDAGDWAVCDTSTGELSFTPECLEEPRPSCHLPDEIENGYQSDSGHNRAKYGCHDPWHLSDGVAHNNGWVWCEGEETKPEHPECVREEEEDKKCHFPDVIFGGFKYEEGENEGEQYAVYMCFPPFVMTPNKHAFLALVKDLDYPPMKAYMTMAYVAGCYDGETLLPSCERVEKVRHCGIPNYIEHGAAVEMKMQMDHDEDKEKDNSEGHEEGNEDEDGHMNDSEYEYNDMEDADKANMRDWNGEEIMDEGFLEMLKMMPVAARYECEEGYKMHKTMHGDWGWCREDGTYEVPSCESVESWKEVEFKLHNGNEKKFVDKETGEVFAGVVMARETHMDDSAPTQWEFGCNDGFNNNAAGAICRSLGYKHGVSIPLTKKMQIMSGPVPQFGWTNFNCKYDDTLSSSANCHGDRYGAAMEHRGMKARCFDFDRMAVKCFNSASFNVSVSLTFTRNKIMCRAMAYKKDNMIDLSMVEGVEAKFMMDDEDLADQRPTYKKKKGYTLKMKNLRVLDFDCLSCEIYAGENMLGKAERCKNEEN